MKGLLIKDLRLLMNQGKVLILMLVAVAAFLYIAGAANPSFVVSYITIVFSFFTASTISYDEYDNCYLFLMTLPVTRKKYVDEKYLYGFLTTIGAWLVAMAVGTVILAVGSEKIDTAEWIGGGTVCVMVAWVFLSIMIPIKLKFEGEKARYVNLIMIGAGCFIVFVGTKVLEYMPKQILERGISFFAGLGNGSLLLISAVITAAAAGISYLCSCRIMKKKEF